MRWFLSLDFIIWLSCIVVGALIKVFLLDDSRIAFFSTGLLVVLTYFLLSSIIKRKKKSKTTSDKVYPKS